MKVIKDNAIVEDEWQRLSKVDGDIPEGNVIVPFTCWLERKSEFTNRNGKLGVCIDGTVEAEEVAKDLEQFDLIALEFPRFTDGRCYSQARLLKDRYDYQGELRAVGDVLRDQLFYMKRCGIDSFELRSDKDFEDALNAFQEFSIKYQTAADGAAPIYKQRV